MDRLAAWLDSYRANLRASLDRAAVQGFRQVHANAAAGELDPAALSGSARRHLRKVLGDLGLEFGGLAVDYPGAGLADPARADQRLAQVRAVLALCAELRVPRAAVTLGGLADPQRGGLARELLAEVADAADRYGVQTAIRNPLDPVAETAATVRALACPALRLAVDTVQLDAPGPLVQAADLLGTLYLRDVRRTGGGTEEVPYGQGEVDFAALLAAVSAADAQSPLVLRHDGPGGVDALRQGREYIASLLSRSGG